MENGIENFIDPDAGRLLWLRSLEQRDRKNYFRSGFSSQDQAIGAWERATLNSIGGFTGVGKTAYLLSLAYRMSRERGTRVFYFNLEMSVPAMWNRLACIHDPALNLMDFRDRDMLPERARYLIDLSDKLSNFSPYFFENADIKEVIKSATAKIERGSDSVLIIDYFALLTMRGFNSTDRFSLQAECAKLLKHLATHLDVPIITAIQLNPSIEQKKDQRPSLADFRGDKEVIHHSNVVLALTHPRRGDLEVYCLKNRNGPLATFTLQFAEERAAIEELD